MWPCRTHVIGIYFATVVAAAAAVVAVVVVTFKFTTTQIYILYVYLFVYTVYNIICHNAITREELLREKEQEVSNPKLPFITTFNKTNIKEKIDSNWKTLNINQKVSKAFQAKPLVAFRRSRNLQDLIGGNTILNNKVVRLNLSKGSSSRCNKGYGSKCCKQVMHTTSFKSTKTGRTYSIREKMNCKMAWLLYLCTCRKCLVQYVGKTEWPFNQ